MTHRSYSDPERPCTVQYRDTVDANPRCVHLEGPSDGTPNRPETEPVKSPADRGEKEDRRRVSFLAYARPVCTLPSHPTDTERVRGGPLLDYPRVRGP